MNFDMGVADRLIGACRVAGRALQDQRGGRESVSTAALAEFRGVFADCFRENVAAERVARSELVHMLDHVARQAQEAKSAAEVEQRRVSELTAWVLAAGWASAGSGVAVDVGPRPSTEETVRPSVNADTARQELRAWASGSTAGASSADPAILGSAVSTFRIQNDTARGTADGVGAAASEFERECSWAHSDLDAVGSGLRRFLEDNQQDATRLSDIASMFRVAGGSGHVGQVTVSNDVLVLATVPASLSGAALLSYLSTATPADTKALATLTGWQQTLQRMDPSTIGDWWAGMKTGAGTAAEVAGVAQLQELLLAAAPAMFGAVVHLSRYRSLEGRHVREPSTWNGFIGTGVGGTLSGARSSYWSYCRKRGICGRRTCRSRYGSGAVVSDGANSGARGKSGRVYSEEELLLGKNVTKLFRTGCTAAFLACVGIVIFVFTNVSWDTSLPYAGKYNRGGSGIPMQIALLPCLIVLFGLWRSGKKPDAHHMGKGGRIAVYIFGTAMIVACAIAQLVMAHGILIAGGFFPG